VSLSICPAIGSPRRTLATTSYVTVSSITGQQASDTLLWIVIIPQELAHINKTECADSLDTYTRSLLRARVEADLEYSGCDLSVADIPLLLVKLYQGLANLQIVENIYFLWLVFVAVKTHRHVFHINPQKYSILA
jgi:hypothetical protein